MDRIKNLEYSGQFSYPIAILRIALGVFLFMKGTFFITDGEGMQEVLAPVSSFSGWAYVQNFATVAHILGGIMIVFGLRTRWAVIAQLPVLIGAIILNFIGRLDVANLLLSTLMLFLCLFFVFYGSGKHSADHYFVSDDDDDEPLI